MASKKSPFHVKILLLMLLLLGLGASLYLITQGFGAFDQRNSAKETTSFNLKSWEFNQAGNREKWNTENLKNVDVKNGVLLATTSDQVGALSQAVSVPVDAKDSPPNVTVRLSVSLPGKANNVQPAVPEKLPSPTTPKVITLELQYKYNGETSKTVSVNVTPNTGYTESTLILLPSNSERLDELKLLLKNADVGSRIGIDYIRLNGVQLVRPTCSPSAQPTYTPSREPSFAPKPSPTGFLVPAPSMKKPLPRIQ